MGNHPRWRRFRFARTLVSERNGRWYAAWTLPHQRPITDSQSCHRIGSHNEGASRRRTNQSESTISSEATGGEERDTSLSTLIALHFCCQPSCCASPISSDPYCSAFYCEHSIEDFPRFIDFTGTCSESYFSGSIPPSIDSSSHCSSITCPTHFDNSSTTASISSHPRFSSFRSSFIRSQRPCSLEDDFSSLYINLGFSTTPFSCKVYRFDRQIRCNSATFTHSSLYSHSTSS